MKSTLIIKHATVVKPDQLVPDATVICQDGRITRISTSESVRIPKTADVIDARNGYVVPGYIDIHVHGGDGADYMDGTQDAVRTANRAHLRHGTTTIFPTTTTGSPGEIRKMITATQAVKEKWSIEDGARIGGIHLYGPFFAPDKVGCHSVKGRRNPSSREYESYFKSGMISIATCAAELPNAVSFYKHARRAGCLVTCGHSNSSYGEMEAAFKAGMRHVDHFYCAMSSVRSLRDRMGTPMQASMEQFVIANREMSTEVIADGYHLAPDLLDFACKVIGPKRLMLVTDANRALDMPTGMYRFGHHRTGSSFESNGEVGHLPGDASTLASSIQGMDHMVRHMYQSTSATLPKVIRMATLTPATRLGLQDKIGSVEKGKTADLLILSKQLKIKQVILNGQPV